MHVSTRGALSALHLSWGAFNLARERHRFEVAVLGFGT